jgi:hypothetical protein
MNKFEDFLQEQIDMRKRKMAEAAVAESSLNVESETAKMHRHLYVLENGGRNALEWALIEWKKLEKK